MDWRKDMVFKTDHYSLSHPPEIQFSIPGGKLPSSRDVFFRAKQREIVDQYSSARIMLSETACSDWGHWLALKETTPEDVREGFQAKYKAIFYESALFFYNALVDLSWTMCYACAEFSLLRDGERIDLSGVIPIDEAAKLLRIAEANVTAPTAEANPFGYLKKMCPEFTKAIDLIICFWEKFSDSEIRKKYNYCKHRGKPLYNETLSIQTPKPIGVYILAQGEKHELPTEAKDVQLSFSLDDSIAELQQFDDEILFPYLQALIAELERVINPSPLAI